MSINNDGYVNTFTGLGTQRDSSSWYSYEAEGFIPDAELGLLYESNGVFSKIIDRPAEETMRRGYDFDGIDAEIKSFLLDMLDFLDWDEACVSAVKWNRLFGGALGVILVDDGIGSLEEPLDYANIRSVEDLLIFDRSLVQPDYNSMYRTAGDMFTKRGRSKFGKPEFYDVYSQYRHFRVHESRCLVFRGGRMPERTSNMIYRFWGVPEYARIEKKLQEAVTSATFSVRLLERCTQAVYKMKGLADKMDTDEGAEMVRKRALDLNLVLSSAGMMFIDSEGEDFEFKNSTLSGINEIIDSTCNMLSAVTNIPQTVLFGRSPAGMNATGESDQENYYSFIERIQKTQIKSEFLKLVDIILASALNRGLIDEIPDYKLKFNPLKVVSEQEQAQIDQQRATTQQIKATTALALIDATVLDPAEVRRALAKEGEWEIDTVLDELTDENLLEMPGGMNADAD